MRFNAIFPDRRMRVRDGCQMNKAGAMGPPGSHHPAEEILQTATSILIKDCTKFYGNRQIHRRRWRKFREVTSDLVLKEGW